MRLRKYVKSKKVLAMILTTVVVITSMFIAPYKKQQINNIQTKKVVQTVKSTQVISSSKNKVKTTYTSNEVARTLVVGATAYCNDPITFTGTKPVVGRTIAVDPNVIPLGSRVYIPEFNAVFIAEDTGGKIKGNRIDIYMKDYDTCMEFGFQTITIYVLKN